MNCFNANCLIISNKVDQGDPDLLKKYFSNLNSDRAQRASDTWDKATFMEDNAVALATGVGFAVACAYSGGFVAACVAAVDEIKDAFFNASVDQVPPQPRHDHEE